MNRPTKIIITLIVIIFVVAIIVWLYTISRPSNQQPAINTGTPATGFTPLNRVIPVNQGNTITGSSTSNNNTATTTTNINQEIPVLRLLSNTPVGGYGANTTGTTTKIRWIDRGRGNVYETQENSLDVSTLSNTVVPRMYESTWSKDLSAFIGAILPTDGNVPDFLYTVLQKRSTSAISTSSTNVTLFELKGKNLPGNTTDYAISPNKDRIFILIEEGIGSSGYTANFDGSRMSRIFTTPLTQLNVEWPTDNTIAITTKGSATQNGYLYFVSPTSGAWTKILGPLKGLSTKVSADGKNVLFSATGIYNDVATGIYNIAKGTAVDASFHTLADKCVWGNFYKEIAYCAVPFQAFPGTYPDDWYKGTLSTVDKIWQINSTTGETKLINQVIGQAGRVIDAFNLGLDNKDNYLYFMNKNDLSLWSLDLVRSH